MVGYAVSAATQLTISSLSLPCLFHQGSLVVFELSGVKVEGIVRDVSIEIQIHVLIVGGMNWGSTLSYLLHTGTGPPPRLSSLQEE